MRTKILYLLLTFAAVMFCCGLFANANAGELTAEIRDIVGTVEVIRAGETASIPAADGMKLNAGDTIKTGSASSVRIIFLPNSFVQLVADAEMKIEKHQLDDKTNSLGTRANLLSGRLRAILKDLPPDSLFEIKTPTAVAGARGTTYYVNSKGEIYVEDGSVTITNLVTGEEFVVYAGQYTAVREDGTVEAPRVPSTEEIETIVEEFIPLTAEPYEPAERPDVVITPNTTDPYETEASEY